MLGSIIFINFLLSQPLFAKTYGGSGSDYSLAVTQATDGGFVLAGYTNSFGAGGDILIVKLTPDGSLGWARTFGGTDTDWPWSLTRAHDGGYVVAGYMKNFGAGGDDFLLLKIGSTGNLEWAYTYGGPYWDWAFQVIQTQDGGYAVTGEGGPGDMDFILLKLAANGSVDWGKRYGGPIRMRPAP